MDFEGIRQEFREKGAVLLPKLLTAAELATCRKFYEEILQEWATKEGKPAGFRATFSDSMAAKKDSESELVWVFEGCPSLAKAAREVWGGGPNGSVWLYQHSPFHKTLDAERDAMWQTTSTPFHRDKNSAPCTGLSLLNLWIPFEKTPKKNCLAVAQGSHPSGRFGDLEGPELEEKIQKGEAPLLSWDLEPGDVIALHSLSHHGGGGLDADFPERNALVLRVFGDDAIFRPSVTFSATSGSSVRDKQQGLAQDPTILQGLVARGLGPPLQEGDHFSLAGDPKGSKHPLLLGPGLLGEANAAARL